MFLSLQVGTSKDTRLLLQPFGKIFIIFFKTKLNIKILLILLAEKYNHKTSLFTSKL